ncbi:MAG: hypothetical protein U1F50_03050 [Rubrivivax sp.]
MKRRDLVALPSPGLQSPDGGRANREPNASREDRPPLVTAWSVIALEPALQ